MIAQPGVPPEEAGAAIGQSLLRVLGQRYGQSAVIQGLELGNSSIETVMWAICFTDGCYLYLRDPRYLPTPEATHSSARDDR